MMRKLILIFTLVLFFMTGKAQLTFDRYGDTYIGNQFDSDSITLRSYGLFVRNYPGLYVQLNWINTENIRSFFQMDVDRVTPCLAGYMNKIVFYRSETGTHNTIVIKRLLSSNGTVLSSAAKKISNPLEVIASLEPVSYYWKSAGDSVSPSIESPLKKIKNYGFVAQQVEKVVPNLVCTDKDLGKSINYDGLIPLLVGSVQNIEGKLMEQNGQLGLIKSVAQKKSLNSTRAYKAGNNIELQYDVPEVAKNVFCVITTMSHDVVITNEIVGRGSGSVELKTADLDAGIYQYAVIVDGNIGESGNLAIIK